MIRPELLKQKTPLLWSPGRGSDLWEMFCCCISGDLAKVKQLLEQDPSLARCNFRYRTPIYFAVRENRIEVAAFLLDHGADPFAQDLLEMVRDRGYSDLQKVLEAKLASLHGASAKGEAVARAIREHDRAGVRGLLDAAPELLHSGDARGNRPMHWAVMTGKSKWLTIWWGAARI
jgi:ankyrin repeat protein